MVELDSLYSLLPKLDCKGKCHTSCGPIAMGKAEFDRMRQKLPIKLPPKSLTCPYLSNNRCRVYEVRPLICRLWGIVETMKCQYGCIPEKYLTHEQGQMFLKLADEISQGQTVWIPERMGAIIAEFKELNS